MDSLECPACGGKKWSHPKGGTRLRACARCGTLFNDRSLSRAHEELLYDHCPSVTVRDTSDVAAAQWGWVRTVYSAGAGAAPKSVLDIGCGLGDFLKTARADGARVAGLDLDPANVAACLAAGIPMTQGSLFDVDLPEGPWDVVTFWDVLDHLEYPVEALRRVSEALSPGGILVARGRNARFHAPLKIGYARFRGLASRLRVPDLSVVHRWGLAPGGWAALFQRAGLSGVRLYPGMPTPGDRYATLGPRMVARALKATLRTTVAAAHYATLGRAYPFPSVLVTGKKQN